MKARSKRRRSVSEAPSRSAFFTRTTREPVLAATLVPRPLPDFDSPAISRKYSPGPSADSSFWFLVTRISTAATRQKN